MTTRTATAEITVVAGVVALVSVGCSEKPELPDVGNPFPDVIQTPVDDASSDTDRLADGGDAGGDVRAPVGLTPEPYTTLQRVWAPAEPPDRTKQAIDDGDLKITDIERYLSMGLGVEPREGRDWVKHADLAPGYPGPRIGGRRSLLYFWQSADPQLVDEESPVRFEGVTKAPVGSTYRPHDHLVTQVYTSHVRSARRISEASGRPFDFAYIAGDFTDNGQRNEVRWALDILAGGEIDPDSGVDNDPVPGPANDYTDTFRSPGIGVPWYLAIGNHETLYAGTLRAGDEVQEAAVGNEIYEFKGRIPGEGIVQGLENGFRDASTRYADVVREGTTPADRARRIVQPEPLLEMIRKAPGKPPGHGIGRTDAERDDAYFSFRPRPGKPIRFVVLDTLQWKPARSGGGMDKGQYQWLRSELDRARDRDELVVVGGHHRLQDFSPISGVSASKLRDLLASYDNVVLYLVGHGHRNAMEKVDGRGGARGYWELMCASTVDFPIQSRIIEIVYDGNGYLSVYVTNLGHNAAPGTLPYWARELAGAQSFFFPNEEGRKSWRKQQRASNLLLRYKLNSDLTDAIESQAWPYRIESLATLDRFSAPE